jgi:ABC-2 type transport system ATP-binding protein
MPATLAAEGTGTESAFLVLDGLSKDYAAAGAVVHAVREVSLSFGRGRIVGIFGNNGAGKTTLTRMIAGLIEPTRGRVRSASRGGQIGLAAADERSFYARLSVLENLRLFGRLHGLARAEADARARDWARRFEIAELLERPFQTLSSGQKQRVNLVRALLSEPELLILDEATRLADPSTVRLVRRVLRELARERGTLILYTGHEFQGLEEDCDEIVVLERGAVVLAGPGRSVLSRWSAPAWRVRFADAPARARALERWPELEPASDDDSAVWPAAAHSGLPARLVAMAHELGTELRSLEWRAGLSVREFLLQLADGAIATPASVSQAGPPERAGLPEAARARRPGTLAVLAALVRRDRLIELSFRFEILLRLGLVAGWGLLLYFVARLVDVHDGRLGPDAFGFMLFGLAVLQISQACLLAMGHQLREEQLAGTLEPLFATGVRPATLLLGSLAWPLGVVLLNMALMIGLAALQVGLRLGDANVPALALALGLGCITLSALGLLSASFVLAFQRGDPVAAVLNLASLVLAGAYFPREFLPGWLQAFSLLLPQTHLLDALRSAAFAGAGLADPVYAHALGCLALEALVFVPLAALALRLALRRARARGGLCQA